MDLTPEARIKRAMRIVREQRDPDSETFIDFEPLTVTEALLVQEIGRLQRAVMGEPEPE